MKKLTEKKVKNVKSWKKLTEKNVTDGKINWEKRTDKKINCIQCILYMLNVSSVLNVSNLMPCLYSCTDRCWASWSHHEEPFCSDYAPPASAGVGHSVIDLSHLLWKKFKSQKNLYNFWHWFVALFTKPIKNWGVSEMIYCKFLTWSKNCRWYRVKMVKNVPKMPEII